MLAELLTFYKFLFFKNNSTVSKTFKHAPKIFEEIINPISRSILNTGSQIASSSILRNVFLKVKKSGKNGFNYYYPKKGWGDALIEPLLASLQKNGVKINFSRGVKQIEFENGKVARIFVNKTAIETADSIVIMAAPAFSVSKLIDLKVPEKFEEIYNVNFKFNHNLPPQICGVINAKVEWFFVKDGIISTTLSAASHFENLKDEEIVKEIWNIFCTIFEITAELPEYRVIKEKRATFICEKNELTKRPRTKTAWDNLFLCGDHVENGLPATIEGAVINGKKVIELIKPQNAL